MIKFTQIDIEIEKRELQMINWKLMELKKKMIDKHDFLKAKFQGIIKEFQEEHTGRTITEANIFEIKETEDYYRLIGEIKSKIKITND